jgi:Resolvase, N terminal domain/Recombinase zinc beta ribbon domain/Recombinase
MCDPGATLVPPPPGVGPDQGLWSRLPPRARAAWSSCWWTSWSGRSPAHRAGRRRPAMTASATSEAPTRGSARSWSRGSAAEKIQPWHWQRLAVVYVRQSTPQQVLEHQESTRLQYGLTERAVELGWAAAQVVVIDDDLGKSGTSVAGRPGFQRLVAEVSLDRVGLILGVQMSRLARSCAAWYQLLEVCAVFSTLLAELGTVNAVLRYLVAHQIQVGLRESSGSARGEVVWRRPNRVTLQNLLKHPLYAGAYVYGRRRMDPRRQRAGRPETGRRVVTPDEWLVLLKDRLPAYISWAEYTANVAQLAANRARATSLGVAREGPALLTRLASCARCGRRMTVHYAGDGERQYFYACTRQHSDYGLDRCQHVAGPPVDALVASQVLAALQPAALELSLEAALHLEQERAELDRLWQQRLERAAYEAERAGRQFHLVEPDTGWWRARWSASGRRNWQPSCGCRTSTSSSSSANPRA